ncbi:flagellar hook-basal body complex protein FliE [Clostridium aminobutyricum]|uniref:Flagellar hook-basal body complex protein FliE n=1 Tax=Clostridium aminobutyricum TaxID=33953 RepID=A0A939IJN3_CLOAM|nr:flagellar hook-basal body complex protein FliE [Clostridium aminobutyricum]MBN7773773.1 flagellar hook-basal body complex protein FliE [Clostridium aminobutyricum]
MFIQPMEAIDALLQTNKTSTKSTGLIDPGSSVDQGAQVPFKSIFEDAIQNVVDTDQQVNLDAQQLATGNSDNLHQYSIDIAKAQLSIDLLVELRNKALDSYSEVMRMSI